MHHRPEVQCRGSSLWWYPSPAPGTTWLRMLLLVVVVVVVLLLLLLLVWVPTVVMTVALSAKG